MNSDELAAHRSRRLSRPRLKNIFIYRDEARDEWASGIYGARQKTTTEILHVVQNDGLGGRAE